MNCLRRYPPVECIGLPDPKERKPARPLKLIEAEVKLSKPHIPGLDEHADLDKRRSLPIIETPRIFGGRVTATNTMNGPTIAPTRQNAELLHFCKLDLAYPTKQH